MSQFKHTCAPENAPKFLDWIKNRGGVAVWKSINLSNPDASWSTPATISSNDVPDRQATPCAKVFCPSCHKEIEFISGERLCSCGFTVDIKNFCVGYPKPNWQCANEPSLVITDAQDIGVETGREVKRFKIHLRVSGMSVKLTAASSEKVRKSRVDAGEGAWYESDGDEAVIFVPASVVSLSEWKP